MVVFMSTLFSSEDILFGESAKGVHIFEKRANIKKGQLPGYGDLCLLFAALILLVVYSGSFVTLKFGIYGSLFVQILIFAVPLLYAFYIRCDIKSLYSIKWPKIREALKTGNVVLQHQIGDFLYRGFLPDRDDIGIHQLFCQHTCFLLVRVYDSILSYIPPVGKILLAFRHDKAYRGKCS